MTEGKETDAAISKGTRVVGSTELSREGPGLCRVEGSWVDLDGTIDVLIDVGWG